MRKSLFSMIMLLAVSLMVFNACNNDDDGNNNTVIVEDGIYVKGAGTALTDFDIKGLMQVTRNEVNQTERASLMEIFVAVKGGTDGFSIVNVVGGTPTYWGPGADFAEVAEGTTDEPKVAFWRGSYTETETPFTVANDGLYHVIIDTELGKVVIVPVQYWGLIGAATPGGWGDDTQMASTGFDLNTMTFEATGVEMTKADFKFRYSGGWKVEVDTVLDLGEGVVGVKVNTNFGQAVDDLVPGGDNIANDVPGIYTATMTWTLGSGYTATLTKTGDIAATDYTNVGLGLTGDGVLDGGVAVGWGPIMGEQTPAVDGTNYTWTWNNVEVTSAGSFKIKDSDPNWGGVIIGYPQVTMAGSAAADFDTNGDGNFVPTADGNYNFTLLIEAATETYTFTAEPATK